MSSPVPARHKRAHSEISDAEHSEAISEVQEEPVASRFEPVTYPFAPTVDQEENHWMAKRHRDLLSTSTTEAAQHVAFYNQVLGIDPATAPEDVVFEVLQSLAHRNMSKQFAERIAPIASAALENIKDHSLDIPQLAAKFQNISRGMGWSNGVITTRTKVVRGPHASSRWYRIVITGISASDEPGERFNTKRRKCLGKVMACIKACEYVELRLNNRETPMQVEVFCASERGAKLLGRIITEASQASIYHDLSALAVGESSTAKPPKEAKPHEPRKKAKKAPNGKKDRRGGDSYRPAPDEVMDLQADAARDASAGASKDSEVIMED